MSIPKYYFEFIGTLARYILREIRGFPSAANFFHLFSKNPFPKVFWCITTIQCHNRSWFALLSSITAYGLHFIGWWNIVRKMTKPNEENDGKFVPLDFRKKSSHLKPYYTSSSLNVSEWLPALEFCQLLLTMYCPLHKIALRPIGHYLLVQSQSTSAR